MGTETQTQIKVFAHVAQRWIQALFDLLVPGQRREAMVAPSRKDSTTRGSNRKIGGKDIKHFEDGLLATTVKGSSVDNFASNAVKLLARARHGTARGPIPAEVTATVKQAVDASLTEDVKTALNALVYSVASKPRKSMIGVTVIGPKGQATGRYSTARADEFVVLLASLRDGWKATVGEEEIPLQDFVKMMQAAPKKAAGSSTLA